MIVTVLVALCLLAIALIHYTTSSTTTGGRSDSSSPALTCPHALVKLRGRLSNPRWLGPCRTSRARDRDVLDVVHDERLSRRRRRTQQPPHRIAGDMRLGYLGGFANETCAAPKNLGHVARSRSVLYHPDAGMQRSTTGEGDSHHPSRFTCIVDRTIGVRTWHRSRARLWRLLRPSFRHSPREGIEWKWALSHRECRALREETYFRR